MLDQAAAGGGTDDDPVGYAESLAGPRPGSHRAIRVETGGTCLEP